MNAPTPGSWRLEVDADGIVWVTIDRPGSSANALAGSMFAEFEPLLERFEREPPRALILISGKKSGFVAGADIKEFTGLTDEASGYTLIRRGQQAMDRLEALKCPTVAAIHGFALGGGLELALACRYRVAVGDERLSLGLPEVQLGIHPGFGGTVRTVRLIGVRPAMEMMLTGKPVRAEKARALGLVDRLVAESELRGAAREIALAAPPFSCSKGEKAFEHTSLRHGVFFYYVIEALSGKADYDKDENVVVDELSLFTRQRVSDFVRSRFGVCQMPERMGKERGLMPLIAVPHRAPLVATSMTVKLKPLMGVEIANLTPEEMRRLGLDESTKGVLIKSVLLASPADQAGLQPDDVITWFDGIPFDDTVAFLTRTSQCEIGKSYALKFLRQGNEQEVGAHPHHARSSPITCSKSSRRMRKRTCGAVLPSSSSTNSTRPLPTSTRQSDSTQDSPPPTNIGG